TFLPSGSTPSPLPTGNLVDPGQTYSNVLAGQVVALTLNVGFDYYDSNFGVSTLNLGDLTIASGTFMGWTVNQLLAEANNVLGGCPSAYTLSQINDAVSAVNENYVDGTIDLGFLECDGLQIIACPQSFTIIRTWTATDACGNTSTASQTISV